MAVVLALFTASVVLNAVVVFSLISRDNATHVQLCHLYLILHRDQLAVVIPPGC